MADDIDMLFGLGPRRFDAQEDVESPEDIASFVVDLSVQTEQYEGVTVIVIGVFIRLERAIVAGVQDDRVNLIANLGRQAENPYRFLLAPHCVLKRQPTASCRTIYDQTEVHGLKDFKSGDVGVVQGSRDST
ncbi:hypothetical protein NUW58_g7871 [Xylaria curta]|uniref:Uncharacterized protein n=1 Tax=Xylaria curta TaxID=42375 RepID=A0ACC1NDX6_9PEZI|nr:hypothetical protein NUW58_g7871 [Xylaria curta]